MVWQAVQVVFIIFALIGIGLFVSWRKWVSADVARVFPKIIINIAIPCTAINSLYSNFVEQRAAEGAGAQMGLPLLIVFMVMPVSVFIGKLAARAFRIPEGRRGIFMVLFSLSNSAFVGFPVAQALFGNAGMPYAVYFYLANTTCFWSFGYYAIRKDANILNGSESRVGVAEVLKKFATPPMITIAAMFVVIFTGLRLPDILLTTTGYIGGMTTPLSLIFVGCMIYEAGLSGFKYEKGIVPVLLGRFVLIPALCFAACTLAISIISPAGATEELILMRNVFTVQVGLPAITQSVIVAQYYGADAQYATKNVIWTTLVSLISIPAYMVLFSFI